MNSHHQVHQAKAVHSTKAKQDQNQKNRIQTRKANLVRVQDHDQIISRSEWEKLLDSTAQSWPDSRSGTLESFRPMRTASYPHRQNFATRHRLARMTKIRNMQLRITARMRKPKPAATQNWPSVSWRALCTASSASTGNRTRLHAKARVSLVCQEDL